MYMHMGERLGPKLAKVLPGPDRQHPSAGMRGRRRLHPGAPRGLPALPATPTRADRPLYLIGPELLRGLPAAGQGHPRARRRTRRAGDRGVGHPRGPRARQRRRRRRSPRESPSLTLPAEDVSYQVVERFFPRAAVRYDTRVPALGQARDGPAARRRRGRERSVAEDEASPALAEARGERAASTGGARSAPRSASPTARVDRDAQRAPAAPAGARTRPATRAATSSRACTWSSRPPCTPRRG